MIVNIHLNTESCQLGIVIVSWVQHSLLSADELLGCCCDKEQPPAGLLHALCIWLIDQRIKNECVRSAYTCPGVYRLLPPFR